MATVRDLIKGSLRLIGAIASGETPSAEEQNDALYALNDMIESWSNENLYIYTKAREEFTLTPGKASYTMGVGGDFNTIRPLKFENVGLIIDSMSTFERPVEIINQDQWAATTVKSLQTSIPMKMWANGNYPLETLHLWPGPTVAYKLVIYSWKPFASFSSPNDTISLPPGYAKALRYGLAIELAPEYSKPIDQALIIQLTEAKENLKRVNVEPQYMEADAALLTKSGVFNWMTGK